MRLTKTQLQHVIEEASQFAATAQEEAEKINREAGPGNLGMSLVADQEFWEKQGIVTGEDLALSVLGQTYSDYFKELHGFRPRHAPFETVEEYTNAISDLDDYYDSMIAQKELDGQKQASIEKERQELTALMPGEFDFQDLPKSSGMGKRMENRIRLTVDDLENIIHEAIDGHPYDGPIEDWAGVASNKWAHGSVVDPQGWKDNCKLGGQFTKGKAPSILSSKKLKMTESQLRNLISSVLIREISFGGLDSGGMESGIGVDTGPGADTSSAPDSASATPESSTSDSSSSDSDSGDGETESSEASAAGEDC